MSYSILGMSIMIIFCAILIFLVSFRERELVSDYRSQKADKQILEKLVEHAKLHNDGRDIEEVIKRLQTIDFEYNPKNSF